MKVKNLGDDKLRWILPIPFHVKNPQELFVSNKKVFSMIEHTRKLC